MPLTYSFTFGGLAFEVHEQTSASAAHPHIAMNTSAVTRILGGGASVILDDPAGAGSLLTASWPAGPSEWDARAKDHLVSSPAKVRIVCVCAPIPGDQHTIASATTSAPTAHPTATAQLPPGYALVGGGARADWTPGDAGSLLYASRPGSGESWFAAAKDHVEASLATVTAFAIGVRQQYLDQLGLAVVRMKADSFDAAPHPVVGCAAGDGRGLLVAGGAQANWTGAGSLLTADYAEVSPPPAAGDPPAVTWVGRAKDHTIPDPATVTAWGIAFVKR